MNNGANNAAGYRVVPCTDALWQRFAGDFQPRPATSTHAVVTEADGRDGFPAGLYATGAQADCISIALDHAARGGR